VGNTAGNADGGLIVRSLYGSVEIVNNLIANNSALGDAPYGFGGLRFSGKSLTFTNNTVVGNHAPNRGGVYIDSSHIAGGGALNVYNNIIADNNATQQTDGADLSIEKGVYDTLYLFNNYFDQTPAGFEVVGEDFLVDESNLQSDPADALFVDAASGDYHLSDTSPVINMGDNDAPGLPGLDLDGGPRIVNGVVDIGADEYDEVFCSAYLDKRSCQSDSSCIWDGNPHNGSCVEAPAPVDCSAYDGDGAACRDQRSCRWSPRDRLCLTK
jgi:hypothetical protein